MRKEEFLAPLNAISDKVSGMSHEEFDKHFEGNVLRFDCFDILKDGQVFKIHTQIDMKKIKMVPEDKKC